MRVSQDKLIYGLGVVLKKGRQDVNKIHNYVKGSDERPIASRLDGEAEKCATRTSSCLCSQALSPIIGVCTHMQEVAS